MRLFLSLVLILALSGTRAHPTPSPKTGPETRPETGPETRPETGPETRPETRPEPGSEECRRLRAPLSLEDKTPVLGRFHFLLGFTDHDLGRTLMNLTSNIWYNVTETKTGLVLDKFTKINGTCQRIVVNATINRGKVKHQLDNFTSEFHFVPLGDSSFILDVRAFATDVREYMKKRRLDSSRFRPVLRLHSFFLMSRRTDVSDADLQLFRDHARCAGFRGDLDYHQQSKGLDQD